MHVMIVFVFSSHWTLFMFPRLLLHEYSCILLNDCFSLLILIFSLLDMWAVDMGCVRLSATWIQATGVTSRIAISCFPISCYLVSCYQQGSCPVIVLHVPCTILVLNTPYSLNIRNITWEWGRLDGWLNLIGWMYWIHIYPTAGMVVLATDYI